MYVDNEQVADSMEFKTHPPLVVRDQNIYLGRPSADISNGQYANAIIDELEFWYANRDYLKAFGLIGDGMLF